MEVRSEVLQAEHAWMKAHRDLDLAQIEALMHLDYTRIQPDGEVWDKARTLASYRSGKRQWDMVAIDQLDIRIYGHAAVVIGRWQAKGVNNNKAFDYAARYTSVWVYEQGRWQMVADQSTDIVDAA